MKPRVLEPPPEGRLQTLSREYVGWLKEAASEDKDDILLDVAEFMKALGLLAEGREQTPEAREAVWLYMLATWRAYQVAPSYRRSNRLAGLPDQSKEALRTQRLEVKG